MIYYTSEKDRANDKVIDTVQADVDYIDSDGNAHIHSKVSEVIVTDASDLAGLTGYGVGSIAYTAGFANMWQLSASGDWVAIVESDDSSAESDDSNEEEGT